MAEETNRWKKRQTERLECPSGAVCYVRRPGPEIALRAGRVVRLLQALGATNGDDPMAKLESLSDDEFLKIMVFAKELVLASVVSPKITNRPDPEKDDEISPDDIPTADFWHIFNWASTGGQTLMVRAGDAEVTVEAVNTFPESEGRSADPVADSEPVSSASLEPATS